MADWIAIRGEYITTDISQRKLADKYSVSAASVNRRAKKENWDEKRETFRNETIQKTQEKISEIQVDTRAAHERIRLKLLEIIEDRINQKDIYVSDIRRLEQMWCDIYDREPVDQEDTAAFQKAKEILGGVDSVID